MKTRTVFGLLRLGAAALCLAALIHRMAWGLASHTVASQNFFAYLTNQSNVAFVVLLSVAGVIALRRARDPRWLSIGLALVLTWTITAGIVFAILVWQAGLRGIRIDVPWSDQVLHFYLPACTVAAWALAPGHRSVPWRVIPSTLIYPVVWGVFTLLRGPLIGWYPYYFLDPRQVSGPLEFVLSSAIALATFAVVATALVLISRMPLPRRPRGRSGRSMTPPPDDPSSETTTGRPPRDGADRLAAGATQGR